MRFALGAILAFCLFSTGCVQFSARPLVPEWTASSQIHQEENSGLSVAVRAMGKGLAETEFIGRPARSHGYFPVVIFFENRCDGSFVIRRQNVQLETHDQEVYQAAPLKDVFETIKYSRNSALWGLPFGIVPAFVLSDQIDEQNQEFLGDLRKKALQDRRLTQQPHVYNCVAFFKMPTEQALALKPDQVTIQIDVECQAQGESSNIQFRLVPEEPLE